MMVLKFSYLRRNSRWVQLDYKKVKLIPFIFLLISSCGAFEATTETEVVNHNQSDTLEGNVIHDIKTGYYYPVIQWYFSFINFTNYNIELKYEPGFYRQSQNGIEVLFDMNENLDQNYLFNELSNECYNKIEEYGFKIIEVSSSNDISRSIFGFNQRDSKLTITLQQKWDFENYDKFKPLRQQLYEKEEINKVLKFCSNSINKKNIQSILTSDIYNKMNLCEDDLDTDVTCYRFPADFKMLIEDVLAEGKNAIPIEHQPKIKDIKIEISNPEYTDDLLWIEYVKEYKTIFLSPYFLRSSFVWIASNHSEEIIDISRELSVFYSPEMKEQLGNEYFDFVELLEKNNQHEKLRLENLSKKITREFKNELMFYIIHELSHEFVNESFEKDEYICDCNAYVLTNQADKTKYEYGINEIIRLSLSRNQGNDYWGMDGEKQRALMDRIIYQSNYKNIMSYLDCFDIIIPD